MACIIGYYNRQGYRTCLFDDSGCVAEELYTAGNNRYSSADTDSVEPDSPNAVNLRTLRSYCRQTSKDIAREYHIPFIGVEREEEPEFA